MIPGEGVHVMPSAGDPQTEPGDCTNLDGRRKRWDWATLSRVDEGYCQGCKSWQRVTGSWLAGWNLEDHEPAPPKHDRCPTCRNPYWTGPSYTDPPCDACAASTDHASYLRGDSAAPETYWIDTP